MSDKDKTQTDAWKLLGIVSSEIQRTWCALDDLSNALERTGQASIASELSGHVVTLRAQIKTLTVVEGIICSDMVQHTEQSSRNMLRACAAGAAIADPSAAPELSRIFGNGDK